MNKLFEKELFREIAEGEATRLRVIAAISLTAALFFLWCEFFIPKNLPATSALPFYGFSLYLWYSGIFFIFALYEITVIKGFELMERHLSKLLLLPRLGNAFIEASIPTIIIYIASVGWNPVLPFFSPIVFVYFIFITLSALRLDPKICIFTGTVAAIEFFLLYLRALEHLPPNTDPELFNVWWNLSKSGAMVLSGAATGSVAFQIRTRIYKSTKDVADTADSFSRFVPHEFLTFLGKEKIEDVTLGDQVLREMTILFSDIRSFTSLSEKMTPRENIDFLNEYLQSVCPIIRSSGGFIDKFIGDAIMALFPGDPDDAITAADAIFNKLDEFNAQRSKQGKEPISIGVGIHTGKLMLGTIGESHRIETTVISDSVNIASRLEGLTKEYRSKIILSRDTAVQLTVHRENVRAIGTVHVKGRTEQIEIFEYVFPFRS
jgi:class 3 adenylate cyclase